MVSSIFLFFFFAGAFYFNFLVKLCSRTIVKKKSNKALNVYKNLREESNKILNEFDYFTLKRLQKTFS